MNQMHLVTWGDTEYKLQWVLPEDIPKDSIVTTAHGYCFKGDELLVVENHRGFELPGGHLDPGENYEAAFKREVLEEACVHVGNVVLLGFIRVEPLLKTTSLNYPSISYMAFCSSVVEKIEDYLPVHECVSRKYIAPMEIRVVHHHWHEIYEPSLLSAVA
ncbi:NUDIX hydrolase [Reinekea marina]|uniref:NUDIX hydrolase n=2 Tax=Reinekea marina TaxID=1310421 RepID=A0ABV7WSW8_9GAMM